MNQPSIYNPRDPRYKSPYGAVPGGTQVSLTLRPARTEGISRAFVTVRFESRKDQTYVLPMDWSGLDLGCDLYKATLDVGDYVGLIFYTFTLRRYNSPEDPTIPPQELGPYQLTVYDGSEAVPTWFGEGMSYQIFPDRFCRTAIPDPTGLVGNRWVHTNWDDEPEYRPDSSGEIRNRDFFGGNLAGVIKKLDYLQGLGVETLYFCPIFEAAENHRYGTADYSRIDPMLGCNEDFSALCDQAHQRGMRVMLDGVFNHTGFVSRYFNGDGFYPETGACQSEDSPYRPWFNFTHWPDQYESWWGIYSLPAVNEHNADYRNFIFGGEDSVARRWLRAGADGWRLDVADELPDDFISGLHAAIRAEKPDGVVIGEVWEDGSNKIAYGVRRKHILGRHCDGLMNYPFRNATLAYLQGGDAAQFMTEMEIIRENYPPFAFYSAMNSLGTHDTPRVLTLLGVGDSCHNHTRQWRAEFRMSQAQSDRGVELLKMGTAIMFAFPGSPMVYYGDEIGMEGFEDPFNRQTYPWGSENQDLLDWFRALGALRKTHAALRRGDIRYMAAEGALLAFTRQDGQETILCAGNAGAAPLLLPLDVDVPPTILLGDGTVEIRNEGYALRLPPHSCTISCISPQ